MVTINSPFCKVKLLIEKVVRLKEYSPEKAGVGGSTPSLAPMFSMSYMIFFSNYLRREGARIVGGAAISVG